MRILMISDVHFPRVNGVSTSIQTFHNELHQLGHDVHIVAPAYPAGHPEEPNVSRIESRYVMLDPEDRLMKANKIYELLPDMQARKFDLVHIQTPFLAHYAGLKLARHLNVPTVETYHTFFEEYLYHYVPLLPKFLTKSITRSFSRSQCNAVDAVIVPSTAMSKVLQQYGCVSPIHISPTGIPLHKFREGDGARFRQQHGIAPDRPMLLHIGRVAHEKNINFLVDMTAKLRERYPDVLFVICGEGPAEDDLKRRVRRLRLEANVQFIGYLDRENALTDCYRAADIFVFASRTETQGLVLLEAMALGVPVVSTAIMGTVDILSANRGALVAEEDIPDFCNKIGRLLDNPELRESVGIEGREYAKLWGSSASAERLTGVYETILSQGPRSNGRARTNEDQRDNVAIK